MLCVSKLLLKLLDVLLLISVTKDVYMMNNGL